MGFYGCNFVGVITTKSYRVSYNPSITERGLIEVQYKYPEIRIPENLQYTFKEQDISAKKEILSLEDSTYILKDSKDFSRHWNGYKVFKFSDPSKKYIYIIRVLNPEKRRCEIGVVGISYKKDDKYIPQNQLSKEELSSAILIFEEDILPKITECVNLMREKYHGI